MRADLTYCDFLVLAPLQLEIDAIRKALQDHGWGITVVNNQEFPSVFQATIIDPSVAHFQRHVVIVQLNHQGVLNASVDTARALELYEPGYVISFGIAGTLNREDAPLGAVIFSTSVIYYEPSKDKSKRTQSRMDVIPTGKSLLNPFRNLERDSVKCDGPLASGEKLIADIDSRDRKRIYDTNDKTLAVEMEAAGVGRAVDRLCLSAEFAVVKGISDLADKSKNRVSPNQQKRNRTAAAANAASCLAQLMRQAPLRRVFRSIPRPSEANVPQTATFEATKISDVVEPYGIRTNFSQLYACLYGRRGPIPAYFHWEQFSSALHWIDFKILSAMKALPKEIVTPVPLVTIGADGVNKNQPWYASVYQLVNAYPITDSEIREQSEEISNYINRVGFTHRAEQEIRNELERLLHTGRPEITLNLMHYMLGQFCHRRMFVFTWRSYRAKWEQLSQAFGTWFSIFEWDTLCLGGQLGKQAPPGQDLVIEPRSYESLRGWMSISTEELVQEFVAHFECHRRLLERPPVPNVQQRPHDELSELMNFWDTLFS